MTPTTTTRITGAINGREHTLEVDNAMLLLDLLRDLGLTGAKPSCEMEVCGACTVQLDGLPVSACTTLARRARRPDGRDASRASASRRRACTRCSRRSSSAPRSSAGSARRAW